MIRSAVNRVLRSKSLPLWLLAVLLAGHLAVRLQLQFTSVLARTHNYPRTYSVSLSLLGGHGFADLAIDDSPSAAPLREFFEQRRQRLTADELAQYFAAPHRPEKDPVYGLFAPLALTRVLDLRLAALLWRICGVDWRVLGVFYSLLSGLTCYLIFRIARQVSGSAWAGLAAAVLFCCSPIEAYLTTFSWRDTSPMWFTAAALAWLILPAAIFRGDRGAEANRSRGATVRRTLLWCLALGVLATLGIGWRADALILPPFLALALVTRLAAERVGWRNAALALTSFACGILVTWVGIRAMGPAVRQGDNIGFHMATYADFQRANMLGIEDTFQAIFSDMQVLRAARQIDRAEHPEGPPLEYLSADYGRVCRKMFFEELDYNVFHWVLRSPLTYLQILSGLDTDSATQQLGSKMILADVPAVVRPAFQSVDRGGHVLPWMFLLGALGLLATSSQRFSVAVLLAFSVYFAAILFLVLPEQKHLGPLLVPLYALSGAGIWLLGRGVTRLVLHLLHRSDGFWKISLGLRQRLRPLRIALLTAAAVWGVASGAAYFHSLGARQRLLDEIQALAAHGTDAPETLRGPNGFAVQIAPGGANDATGYLLKIEAGAYPNTLACRQVTFPRDWYATWGRALMTYHRLYPNRSQYFFVSCLQGGQQGDPRPYLCSVEIHGDARITACTRVDLSGWTHSQVTTLFHGGRRSPGSPREGFRSCDWMFVNLRALADSADLTGEGPDYKARAFNPAATPSRLPQSASPTLPVRHLAAHSLVSGAFQAELSDGRHFTNNALNFWAPATHWSHLKVGDFNGDGLEDFVGQTAEGQWWWAICDGAYHGFKPLAGLPAGVRCDYVGVGDFNGDGLDDVAIRAADGRWWLALSTGTGFDRSPAPAWTGNVPPENLLIGDFLGNGHRQIAGLDPHSGQWTLAELHSGNWVVQPWVEFGPHVYSAVAAEPQRNENAAKVQWRHPVAGDFLGTGHALVAAWNSVTRLWQLGGNDEFGLPFMDSYGPSPAGDWKSIQSARLDGGAAMGIAALDPHTGEIVFIAARGRNLTTRRFPGHPSFAQHLFVGDFAGLGHDQLLGLAADGQLWLGTLGPGGLKFESRGSWPDAQHCADFRVIGFWPQSAATIRR